MSKVTVMPKVDAARPPDWESREAALDVERSWIVEAPAGSGKTGLLIQRYLKLLGQKGVTEPGQVLAITFTRKATQEIRERVVEQLQAAAEAAPLKRDDAFERTTRELAETVLRQDEAYGWGLVEQPKRLRVQTIDSVCTEIARSLPVLSGSGGGMTPMEDASPLYREAAQRTLMQLGGEDPVLHTALERMLLHRDGNLRDCERLIAEMLARREQWAEFVPLRGEDLTEAHLDEVVLPRLERALELAICAGLTRLARAIPEDVLQQMASLAGEFAELEPYKPEIHPFAICRGMRAAPGETVEHLEHWRALVGLLVKKDNDWRKRFQKNDLEVLLEKHHGASVGLLVHALREREDVLRAVRNLRALPPAKYPEEQWREAKALFRVLRHALAELKVVFAERGECDFTELTLLAKNALRDGGTTEMSTALGMRLEHLLVDEMQDTSTSHYEVIEMLTQGWDGVSQTVFLVGDPKQSIYMFRQARVELFLRTMETGRLGDLPLGRLKLMANFRSQAGLVEVFNEDFDAVFPDGPGEVAFVEAVPVRPTTRSSNEARRWHTHTLPAGLSADEGRDGRQMQREEEANTVRAMVERWRATTKANGEPWKIAVLVRNRSHLLEIVEELKGGMGRAAIPFRAVDIEALGKRQEVLDLFAVTRALLHPADRVAWLALLRAPWCGMSLADLHVLTGGDDSEWHVRTVWEAMRARGEFLSEDGIARLQRVWQVMEAAEQQRGRVPVAEWVERTWLSLGGDTFLRDEERDNAGRYLQELSALEQEGRLDLTQLASRMKRLYAESPVRADALELVTIHKAKGLEWDVVLVPGLERVGRNDGGQLLTWEEMDGGDGGAAHVVLAPIEGRGKESEALNTWLKGIRSAREAAERRRLLYVACTRAREELHLFASTRRKSDGGIAPPSGSLLEAAWPAAEDYFGVVPAQGGAKVISFASSERDGVSRLALAASAGEAERGVAMIQRLPLSFDAAARFERAKEESEEREPGWRHFDRPEGSFAARAFGNAVHAFLELATARLGKGESVEELLRQTRSWGPRIETVLRGSGLPPAVVKREGQRVLAAIETALRDSNGLWILGAREASESEYSFTTWEERRSSFRLDRIFAGGAEPLASGSDCLWIIDFKTTSHGQGVGVEAFLAEERAKYGPQMESYAKAMQVEAAGKELRVGLYYPLMPKLLWWRPA